MIRSLSNCFYARCVRYGLLVAAIFVIGCEAPVEPIRQNPRDPDYFLGQNIPSPATQFRYENTLSGGITLFWEDNSSFGAGFVIEQAVNLDSVFSDIDEVGPNAVVYQENGIGVSVDTMLYRVRSFLDGRRSISSDTLFLRFPFQPLEGEYGLRAVHPTEKRLLVNSSFDTGPQLLLWQPDRVPDTVVLFEDKSIRKAAFDVGGNWVAICNCFFSSSNEITVLELAGDGTLISSTAMTASFRIDEIKIFSRLQRVLAFEENQLNIWETSTGNPLVSWTDFDEAGLIVFDVTYDAAGRLWTLSKPGPGSTLTNFQLTEWRIQNDSLLVQLQLDLTGSPGNTASGGRFSPDGQRVATFPKSMGVHEVCIWDVATGARDKCLSTGPEQVLLSDVKFNLDATRISVAFEEGRSLYARSYVQDIASEQIRERLKWSFELSDNLRYFVSSSQNLIALFDLENDWESLYED